MAYAYSPDNKPEFLEEQGCLHEPPPHGEEHEADEDDYSDAAMALLEENARLRGLVIRLTDIILRNVVDRG